MCCADRLGRCTVLARVVRVRVDARGGLAVRVCDVLPRVCHMHCGGTSDGRCVGARRDQCTVSSGWSSMVICSTSVALVRSPGPLGGLRTHVCVDEDIAHSDKEITGRARALRADGGDRGPGRPIGCEVDYYGWTIDYR
jgi:hypothetical protein